MKKGDKVTLVDYLASAMKLCENPAGPELTRVVARMMFDAVDTNN